MEVIDWKDGCEMIVFSREKWYERRVDFQREMILKKFIVIFVSTGSGRIIRMYLSQIFFKRPNQNWPKTMTNFVVELHVENMIVFVIQIETVKNKVLNIFGRF